MITIIISISSIVLLFWSSWLLLNGVISRINIKKSIIHNIDSSVLIIVPAHNEEITISKTLKSLIERTHHIKAKIIVLADNCSDKTIEESKKYCVEIVERQDKLNKGKGAALNWYFKNNENVIQEYEYISIIDADTVVNKNYFETAISDMKTKNLDVLQSYYTEKSNNKNYSTTKHSLEIAHNVRQQGMFNLIGQCLLKGNGMLFKNTVLLDEGWDSRSIVEDLDYSYYLITSGYKIGYSQNSIVYGEISNNVVAKGIQQKRWEGGRWKVMLKWIPNLFNKFKEELKVSYLLLALDLSVPPIMMLFTFIIINTLVSGFVSNYLLITNMVSLLILIDFIFLTPRKKYSGGFDATCIEKIKELYKIKLKVFYSLITEGVPKTFERTPRLNEKRG